MLRRKRATTVAEVDRTDSWTLSQGTWDDRPIFARIHDGFLDATDREAWAVRIGVAVPLLDPNEHGLPGSEEGEALGVVEDQLLALVAGRAVLVAVLTTGGMREFVLHATEGDWIGDVHHALAEAAAHHEVQVMAVTDPEWETYRSFLS